MKRRIIGRALVAIIAMALLVTAVGTSGFGDAKFRLDATGRGRRLALARTASAPRSTTTSTTAPTASSGSAVPATSSPRQLLTAATEVAAALPSTVRPPTHYPPPTPTTTTQPPPIAATVTDPDPEPSRDQLLFDGQSFNFEPTFGDAYPGQLMRFMRGRLASGFVVGVSGTSYAERAQTASQRVDPHVVGPYRSTLLDIAGQSDLVDNLTAVQILAAAESYADARRAAGATFIVIFTVTPSTRYARQQEAERVAYDALLRKDAHHKFDAVVDIASRREFVDPTNKTYISDGMHPTAAGAEIIARMAWDALNTLFAQHK